MDTRRDFIKKATVIAAGTGLAGSLPLSIQKALAINPELNSTYLDAEHIVILMQENRSFDHCYGSLQGVRGFNDPHVISLPDKNLVWMQTNKEGETFLPFRLNIKDTKATWIGSLPHGWTDQVDARNNGRFDKWLDVKRSGTKGYEYMPLTMGYYNREDIPFYYALADAFTICDQNFCSSLTGTTPNRLHLWTGTIRAEQNENSRANVWNEEVEYASEASWTTFPERLEDEGVSWKIYQNELSVGVGFKGEEEEPWLANFGDNPIEYFSQYNVRFLPSYVSNLHKLIKDLPGEIEILSKKMQSLSGNKLDKARKKLEEKKQQLQQATEGVVKWSAENYQKLSQREKNLHERAFATNSKDPDYHQLTTLRYRDGSKEREVHIPKGDILYQFREDVKTGKLPTVSWIVAPETFSDHPSAPWYGAWYVSEVMDILTQNPNVWKKTIFILCYDENDGYFDHVPPFVAPHPDKPDTGETSKGINSRTEYVTKEEDLKGKPEKYSRESPVGLGYRVPLVIASPWSRGGAVCSQVFDHTSILQLLENFLSHKTGKEIREHNISDWRRTVCGDLTSVFTPYNGEKIKLPEFPGKNNFIESVHKAQFKRDPYGFKKLTRHEIEQINKQPHSSSLMPQQEKGVRRSCALPYQLYIDGKLSEDKKEFAITFEAKNDLPGKQLSGSPFNVYVPGKYMLSGNYVDVHTWAFAVSAGDSLQRAWKLDTFENNQYHFRVYGPNGFFREFRGDSNDPNIDISCTYHLNNQNTLTGDVELKIINRDKSNLYTVEIKDNAYKTGNKNSIVAANSEASILVDLSKSSRWYDFTVIVKGKDVFEKSYAGRVETGEAGYTDPAMGKVV
ncbi:MAG: phospholipase C, phosphocholine-specific [Ginsengibacter sp.]